jgi:hypothetical protein
MNAPVEPVPRLRRYGIHRDVQKAAQRAVSPQVKALAGLGNGLGRQATPHPMQGRPLNPPGVSGGSIS